MAVDMTMEELREKGYVLENGKLVKRYPERAPEPEPPKAKRKRAPKPRPQSDLAMAVQRPTTLADETWGAPHGARVLWFPWDFVLSDNERFGGEIGGRLTYSREYRIKKAEARTLAQLQWGPAERLAGDLVLVARCRFPNDGRRRDAGNYRKLITDALTGVVYSDDSQLISETWGRAQDVAYGEARIEVLVYPATTTEKS